MFYKRNNNSEWYIGEIVNLPNGEKLTKDNKQSLNGWEWHDTPPQEYLEWIELNNHLE